MPRVDIITNSPAQTKKAGEILAKEILRLLPQEKAFVVGLVGDLGGGKTIFTQGFARGLKIKEKILSPTFVILKKYEIPAGKRREIKRHSLLFHIDCYRTRKPKEILALGLNKILSEKENIILIEWAEKIKEIIPPKTLWIDFIFLDRAKRKISLRF